MRRLIPARIFRTISAALVLAAASLPAAAQAVFPNQGTIGLVPPPGMTEISGVSGFEDRDAHAAILILEMPAAAFAEISTSFRPEALQSQGVTVESQRELTLAGGEKAILFTGYQSVGANALKKWILFAGGERATAMVTVQFPEAASARYPDSVVEAALNSVTFRAPPSQEEMLARLPFTIGDLQGYRVLQVLGGSAVLLTKGDATEGGSGSALPFFIVGVARGEIREADRESLAKRAIASAPGVKNLRVERGGPLRIGGQPGYELLGNAEDVQTGKPLKVVQWLSFGRASYLRMVGVAPADGFTESFDAMRALRDSVEPR